MFLSQLLLCLVVLLLLTSFIYNSFLLLLYTKWKKFKWNIRNPSRLFSIRKYVRGETTTATTVSVEFVFYFAIPFALRYSFRFCGFLLYSFLYVVIAVVQCCLLFLLLTIYVLFLLLLFLCLLLYKGRTDGGTGGTHMLHFSFSSFHFHWTIFSFLSGCVCLRACVCESCGSFYFLFLLFNLIFFLFKHLLLYYFLLNRIYMRFSFALR